MIDLFSQASEAALLPRIGSAVGMWGALEVNFHGGPVHLDTMYDIETTVAAIGDSPKTEILWCDSTVTQGNRIVATGRILSRFVKASSPLYVTE